MPQFVSILILSAMLTGAGCTFRSFEVFDLRCENLSNPSGIENAAPHLSWKIKSVENGTRQQAYQILAASDLRLLSEEKADLWNTGKVTSPSSVMTAYAGKPLSSCSRVYWKVRVWNEKGDASRWSDEAFFGIGLSESDWKGDFIGLSRETGNPQSPLLRTQFDVSDKKSALFLYVASLGYHEAYINGAKVSDDVLSPAVSQLDKRVLFCTYDVSPYVRKGKNDLVIWLGQGWYRPGLPGVTHDGPLAKVQLEEWRDGSRNTIVVSDASWKGRESGYSSIGTWRPHQFGGEYVDGASVPEDLTTASLDRLEWHPAIKVEVPERAVSAQMTEPNRIRETIDAVDVRAMSDSIWVADMGKTLTGRVEIGFPTLQAGQKIDMSYADRLNDKGDLVNQGQRDVYVASGKGKEIFRNKFNSHGFRFVKISGLAEPPAKEAVKAYPVHTDYRTASSFQCSDNDMNAIHDMIQYTFRCLTFGGYMVDCPQHERLGYGGDGNASTETAQTMFDLSPLYANWMQAWADCIREDGGMPHTAPNPYKAGGGPYWCGFIITASWRTYVNYGDARLIEKYYPEMQQWLGYAAKYSVDGLLKRWPDTDYRNWYLGDWACPKGIDQRAEASVDLVNNCFIVECYRTMEKIARSLGKTEDAEKYAVQKAQLQQLIQKQFFNAEENKYGTATQIDLVYPMLTGVTPDSLIGKVADRLYLETEKTYDGHIACGLVGIPVLTEWAVKNRAKDLIYSGLKKRTYPGYLYMIDNGAVTTWEHWDGTRSRIHNCYNGIGSWFYQAVGGIIPDEAHPGYREVFISPQIPEGIDWAKTTKETPYGTLIVDWRSEANVLHIDITVPVGCKAKAVLPEHAAGYTLDGIACERKADIVEIESGKHVLSYPTNKTDIASNL